MTARPAICVKIALFMFALAGGALAFAGPTNNPAAGTAARPAHSTQAIPATLRPALYGALNKDAGPAYDINKKGCATLPKQKLTACFDDHGAHFTGAGSPLALRLIAYGRIPAGQTEHGGLTPVKAVKPVIRGNQASYVHGNLTEWWRVLPVGFEQGFTIAKRPGGRGELTLALATNNKMEHDKGALASGKLRYGDLIVTDANGKVVPATLKHEDDRILIAVNDSDAVYPLTVDPLVWLEQKVAASDGAEGDTFGFSVAVSGSSAIVATPFATVNGHAYQGAAYVFTRSNGVWAQTQKLSASNGAASDYFGYSVALDGSIALVGTPHAGVGGNAQQGAVYVFTRSGSSWTQSAELAAGDGAAYDNLGWTVALSDTTALAGAPFATVNGHSYQGAAYVFTETDGTWTQTQKLSANDGATSDEFAATVALDGTTALVGAPYISINGNGSQGAVYVFTDSNGAWTQEQKLTASDGGWGDEFGSSLSVSNATALIGAEVATVNGQYGQGAAYVFTHSNGTWTQTQKLTANDGAAYDSFGWAVTLKGTTALVGAVGAADDNHPGQGAVYVFTDSSGTWMQTRKLTSSDGASGDGLGGSVALSDATALAGAYYANVNVNASQGAAYFYDESDLDLSLNAPQTVNPGQNYTGQTIATNNGSAASPAVAVTVAVPAAASFVSATANQGSCSEASGVVTCDFGPINGNAGMATANVTLKATGAPGTTIANTASVSKTTPALTASTPTTITAGGACPEGYSKYDGNLNPGQRAHSPIYQAPAGEENAILTGPTGFQLYAAFRNDQGQKIFRVPGNEIHRHAPAGTYAWAVKAGTTGGAYTLCVLHP